jgi:uncharacterized protein (TIGR00251 family)
MVDMDIRQYINKGRLLIIAKPNSRKNEILGYDNEKKAVKIAIAAQPEDGKANKELIKFLSKECKIKARIISGLTSREKLLEIL